MPRKRSSTPSATPRLRQAETPDGRPQTRDRGQQETDTRERPQTSAAVLVDILRGQLQVLREELQEARQSAQAAREREARLLQMLQDMQHRYDRLLDLPRPPALQTPQDAPAEPPAPRRMRKLMPRQIRALRDKHLRGVPLPALMDEYQISKASLFRYLRSDKRGG
jgi:hypothetical protein